MRPAWARFGTGLQNHAVRARHLAGAVFALTAALLLTPTLPAQAHRVGTGRTDGLSIPSLSHGQMLVIDNNRAAVFALAVRTAQTDETFRRLFNYAKIQHTVCLWGLVPGSVTDEQNPFNGCAHAYLAATRALLDYMRDRPGAAPAAVALADKVDQELFRDGTLALCTYSGDSYNTADMIYPQWSSLAGDRPHLLTGGGILAIVCVSGLSIVLWQRRRISTRTTK